MKKNMQYILTFISVLLILCGCSKIENKQIREYLSENKSEDKNRQTECIYDYYVVRLGNVYNMTDKDSKSIITSYNDLIQYCEKYDQKTYDLEGNIIKGKLDQYIDRYNDEYFKTKSLAMVYVDKSSISDYIDFKEPVIQGNTVIINYNIINAEIALCAMDGELIIIEISKDITTIK